MYGMEKKKRGSCPLPSAFLRLAGLALIAIGVLILMICIPLRYWLALLGLGLAAAGLALRLLF